MKAVLDSSVLVSAFFSPNSTSANLLERASEGVFTLCLSREILEETRGVLMRDRHRTRLRYAPEKAMRYCDLLKRVAECVKEQLPDLRVVPLDPKDDMIIATAVAVGANYLVTGDRRHLLPIGTYEGIHIVTPREFLDLLIRKGR